MNGKWKSNLYFYPWLWFQLSMDMLNQVILFEYDFSNIYFVEFIGDLSNVLKEFRHSNSYPLMDGPIDRNHFQKVKILIFWDFLWKLWKLVIPIWLWKTIRIKSSSYCTFQQFVKRGYSETIPATIWECTYK